MRRWLMFALLLLLFTQARRVCAGEVIDRIAATVNTAAILESDVEEAARYEALLDGRPARPLNAAARRVTLERLIDQELLRQQIGANTPGPAAAEIAERMNQLRQQAGQTGEAWKVALGRYGLSEDEVRERLQLQLRIGRYIEQRLRPGIHVDDASVEEYYRTQLLPELRKSGVENAPALRQVRQQIEEILVQQRMGEELNGWLRSLREQSRVRLAADLAPAPSPEDEKPPRGGK
jgi:hypothetical protein